MNLCIIKLPLYKAHATAKKLERHGTHMVDDFDGEETLELTGLVYPPVTPGASVPGVTAAGRTMTHACEEFSLEELAEQLPNLKGLPVCIEHDKSELIGSVTDATMTHSGAVQVRAIVSASSSAGRRAISDIRSKKMVGLSLSHNYDLFARNGSPLKIVVDKGGDWGSMLHRDGDSAVIKRFLELSVCSDPKRIGCCIHELEGSSRVLGMVDACRKHAVADINNESQKQDQVRKETVSLWNIVNKSAHMESSAPAVEQADAGASSAAAQQFGEPVIATPAVAVAEEPVIAAPVADVAPAIVPEGDAAAAPGEDAPAGDESVGADVQLQMQVQDALQKAQAALTDQASENDRFRAEHADAAQKNKAEMDDMRGKLQAMQQAEDVTKKQIAEHKSREISAAEANSKKMLSQLQETLRGFTKAPVGAAEFKPDASDPVQMFNSVGKLAGDAIKTMEDLTKKTNESNMASVGDKRRYEQVVDAFAPFGGMGTVNASANKSSKINDVRAGPQDTCASQLREWMQQNQSATWSEVQQQYGSLNATPMATGTVNASAGTWSRAHIEEPSDVVQLSAMQMQPALFSEMCALRTGRKPSASEVTNLCDSVNRTSRGPRR